ncbi:MAG: sulfatase-like hydrolase/transferase [Myxococcales bacterium]|nr:sulfatase-like hydrolase/transferase [Myxococcales bacterium]
MDSARPRLHAIRNAARSHVFIGALAFGAVEILITFAKGYRYFLGWHDVFVYVVTALLVAGACVRGAQLVVSMLLGRRMAKCSLNRKRRGAIALAVFAACALVLDGTLYVRLYAKWHALLTLGAVFGIAAAIPLWQRPDQAQPFGARGGHGRGMTRHVAGFGLSFALGAIALFWLNVGAPNASWVARDYAVLTGKLIAWLPSATGPEVLHPSLARGPDKRVRHRVSTGGIDLSGSDVLLVTVDALRADCLSEKGGGRNAPYLDALAKQSMVFRRAYTPSPNTSYALSSLLTGKYARSLDRLGGNINASVTLADILNRAGYQTAAFYPPAMFAVDGHKLAELRARGFGFRYTKETSSNAETRVQELAAFMSHADARPVFAWVHFLEPHEPYEPTARFYRGDSQKERYAAEVARADKAIHMLVDRFGQREKGMLLILSADHGEEFNEHGGQYHGSTLYDEQARVPLLWFAPGHIKPQASDVPVELVDVATTLLSLLGLPSDPRMAGDDWSGVIGGGPPPATHLAFAEIKNLRMAFDGRYKAICLSDLNRCQLFDIMRDPTEMHNLALDMPERSKEMAQELAAFYAALPAQEQLRFEDETAWPEAMARARLGDASAAPALMPLLGDDSPGMRAAAVRELGMLGYDAARSPLKTLVRSDRSLRVRAESALALVRLKDHTQIPSLRAYLSQPQVLNEAWSGQYVREAALTLGETGDRAAGSILIELARDENEDLERREVAIVILGRLKLPQALDALIPLLADGHLGVRAAGALGMIGGKRAEQALRKQLEREPYPQARAAQQKALLRIQAKQ